MTIELFDEAGKPLFVGAHIRYKHFRMEIKGIDRPSGKLVGVGLEDLHAPFLARRTVVASETSPGGFRIPFSEAWRGE